MTNGSSKQGGDGTDVSLTDFGDVLSGLPTHGQRAQAIGKLQTVMGLVTITRANVIIAQPAVGDLVYQGDVIETGIDGLIAIVLADGTTFQLCANAHTVLDEFICGGEKSSNSVLLRIVKGAFGFISGKAATTGRLIIDTPVAQIQSTGRVAGIGSLAFGVFTFGLIDKLKAASADIALLDDGTIDYKDLKHGVFEIRTHEAHPRIIVVDDPGETIVLRPRGAGAIGVETVANSPTQMAQLQVAYQGALATFSLGQQDPFIQQWHGPNDHANAQPQSIQAALSSSTSPNLLDNPTQLLQENGTPVSTDTALGTTTSSATVAVAFTATIAPTLGESPATHTPSPTLSSVVEQTLVVNKGTMISPISLSEAGTTSGEIFTVTLTDTHGDLSATGSGTIIGAGTTSLTIIGTLSQVNSDLSTLTVTEGTPGSDTITLNATDSFGNSATPKTIDVTVAGLPSMTVPGPQTLVLNKATLISDVSLSETGNTSGETFTVTLTDTHGALSATGSGITGSGTTNLTINGTLSQVSSDLATLTDADGTPGSDTITLNATDSFGNSATQQTIDVTVAGLPSMTVPGPQTLVLNKATLISDVSLSETGNTSGETFTVTLTDTHGALSATGLGGITGSGTNDLVVEGTLTEVNADLTTLHDTDSTPGPDNIAVGASDSFGNSATQQTIDVTVAGLPSMTVPGPQTLVLNKATLISDVSLSETGNTSGETFTVTLTDTHGDLSANTSATGGGGTITGSGTNDLIIQGTLTEVNADLTTLHDTDGTPGPDNITVNASDSFGNSATQQTIDVTVAGLPSMTVPGPQTLVLNKATLISDVSLSETGNTSGETFTVTLTDTHGDLSANTSATGGGGTITGSGTNDLVVEGTLTEVNADLTTLHDTDSTPGPDNIAVGASDSFGNSATQQTIDVTVAGLPVISVPGAQTLEVGQAATISDVSLSETGNTSGETFTVTLTDTHGDLSANTSATGGGGTITGSGTNDLIIQGTLTEVNADLTTLHDTDSTPGPDSIAVGASDSFGNSAAPQTIPVTVNAPPTTLTFDDLPSPGSGDLPIPNGYGGLNWSNFYYLDGHDIPNSGYYNGTVSAPDVAYNNAGQPASVTGTTFNFIGADLTAAWNDGLSITVDGYDNGVLVDEKTVVANTIAPTFFQFDFNGITELLFSATGGTNAGYGGIGTQFVMDDFTFTAVGDPGVTIAAGASYEINSPYSENVLFAASTGTLVLAQPATFTGEIAGISGSGDILDLKGFGTDTTVTIGSYSSATSTTTLTVTDSSQHLSASISLFGDYSTSTFTITSDNAGGIDIADPPATNPSQLGVAQTPEGSTNAVDNTGGTLFTDPPTNASATAEGVISLADVGPADTYNESVTPHGSGYVGTFSVYPVSVNNGGGSVGWQFDLGNDQINLAPGQTVTQSYEVAVTDPQNVAVNSSETVSVSIGGPGNDNFVFQPGIGADTIINFNPQVDTIELDHFANVQTIQELASLITTNAHGDAVIDLGHNDSITLPGVDAAGLHAVLQSVVHLH